MKHAKGFTIQAQEFERLVHRNHPDAVIAWEMPLTIRPDGNAAGRAVVKKTGHKAKLYTVVAELGGHWYSI